MDHSYVGLDPCYRNGLDAGPLPQEWPGRWILATGLAWTLDPCYRTGSGLLVMFGSLSELYEEIGIVHQL